MRRNIFMTLCLAVLFNVIVVIAAIVMALYIFGDATDFIVTVQNTPPIAAIVAAGVIAVGGFVVNYILATTASRKITSNISQIDFTSPDKTDTFKELSTFVGNVAQQQSQMGEQFEVLALHSDTVRSILGNMQDGFIILDRFAAIFSINPKGQQFFNADASCIGKNINGISKDPVFLDKVKAALQGHGGQMYIEKEQLSYINFIPSPDRGIVILISDITEHQLTEKMRREFAANVSHELNSPLTMVAGFAELISKGQMNEDDTVHFASKIEAETKRMLGMIESIIHLAKLEEMDGPESFVRFDISRIAAEAVEDWVEVAEKSEIEISLSSSLCPIYGSRYLFYVLFNNLISNAVYYNKPRGTVKIAVSLKNEHAYINVADTGIGMTKEEQYRAFERFYRTEHSKNHDTDGVGLGLSIVKHIVRYHNGTINMESEPGAGTRIFIKIPQEP